MMQLLPSLSARRDGQGPAVRIENEDRGSLLRLGFDIARISERQGIQLDVWGSTDGEDWGRRPVLTVPTKYYCGHFTYDLDLTNRPDIRYLRVKYRLRDEDPMKTGLGAFFGVTAEAPSESLALAAH